MTLHLAIALALCLGISAQEGEDGDIAGVPAARLDLGLIPPKYKPGDIMTRTDFESVDNALDDVLRAGNIFEGRRCAIGVSNLGFTDLTSPKWYMESGLIYSSAPYTIPLRQTGLTLFHKRSFFIWGTTGLLTYDISGTDYKVAIMWQVPWNFVMYNVLVNVKVYHKDVPTDKNLFNQMKKYGGPSKSTGWLEKDEYGIKVLGTITEKDYAKLYVSVDATDYDKELGPQLHTECDLHPLWLGNYCWQECTPTGYCWANRKCNTKADCGGPLQCYTSCKKE